MLYRKVFVIFAIVILLLVACADEADPTPAPTDEPEAAVEEPAEEPTDAPAEEEAEEEATTGPIAIGGIHKERVCIDVSALAGKCT